MYYFFSPLVLAFTFTVFGVASARGTVVSLRHPEGLRAALEYDIGDYASKSGKPSCFPFPAGKNLTGGSQGRELPLNETAIRCLPSYSIIGLPKRGTSSLYHYFRFHPNVESVTSYYHKERCPRDIPANSEEEALRGFWLAMGAPLSKGPEPQPGELRPGRIWGDACIQASAYFGESVQDVPYTPWSLSDFYVHLLSKHSLLILLVGEPIGRQYAAYKYWCTAEELEIPAVRAVCEGRINGNRTPRRPIRLANGTIFTATRSPEDFHRLVAKGHINLNVAVNQVVVEKFKRASNLQILPQELLHSETNATMNYLLRRLNLPALDYSRVAQIAFNRGDNPGIGKQSRKKKTLQTTVLQETRVLMRKDACELAKLFTDNSQFDFYKIWKYESEGFCKDI